jgi:hypothetical protein
MNTAIEPLEITASDEMVERERRLRGGDTQQARERLERRLAEDARRLSACLPGASGKIRSAMEIAAAKQSDAEALLEQQREILDDVMGRVEVLGRQRLEIADVRNLTLSPDAERNRAFRILEKFGARNNSPAMHAEFMGALQDLALMKAVAPFVAEFVAEREAAAADLAAEIKAVALEQQIDLPGLLAVMRADTARFDICKAVETGAFTGLIERATPASGEPADAPASPPAAPAQAGWETIVTH